MKKILVQHRDSRKKEIFFAEEMPITVGRSAECTVSIDEDLSDDVAVRIEALEGDGYRVVDLSSSRNLRVNGVRVEGDSEFGEGDAINLGRIEVFLGRVGVVSSDETIAENVDNASIEKAEEGNSGEKARATGSNLPGSDLISGSKSPVKRAVGLLRKFPELVRQKTQDEADADEGSASPHREEAEQWVQSRADENKQSGAEYEPGSFWSRGVQHGLHEDETARKRESGDGENRPMPDFQRRRIFPERQIAQDLAEQGSPEEALAEGGMHEAPESGESGQVLSSDDLSTGAIVDGANSAERKEVDKLVEQKAALIEEITLLESQQVTLRDERRALEKEVARERAQLALIKQKVIHREAELVRLDDLLAAHESEALVRRDGDSGRR